MTARPRDRRPRSRLPLAALVGVALLGGGCITLNNDWVEPAGDSDGGSTSDASTSDSDSGTTSTDTDASGTASATEEPTTDDSGSTPATTASGTTADVEDQFCGNNEPEGDEECDDGNMVEGDGCSDQCHDEPMGVELGELDPSDVAGDQDPDFETNACAVEGGSNALHGAIVQGDAQYGTIKSLQADCAKLVVEPSGGKLEVMVEPEEAMSPTPWGEPGALFDNDPLCSPDEIVRAFRGTLNDYGLSSLDVGCSKIHMAEDPDEGFGLDYPDMLTWNPMAVGYEEGVDFEIHCPDGSPVAAGFKIFDQDGTPFITGIELLCHDLDFYF